MHHPLSFRLVDATATEPGLLVELRDQRRALLFDLGPPIAQLPPRVLLRVSHAFVSHTHMDHWAGFDHWLGVALGRVPRLVLWGGPGFVDQVEHKLRAYTWNVVHRYDMPLAIEANELRPDGTRQHARFDSAHSFGRADDVAAATTGGDLLHDDALFRVRARFVDHEMPVLAFAIEEKALLRVASDRIAAAGLTPGPWLRELKAAVLADATDDTPIRLRWRDRAGSHADTRTLAELRHLVLDEAPGRRIGYVTDLRFSQTNVEQLATLLGDADVLHIESVFLHADLAHAQRKNHLTARQAGEIAHRLRAKSIVPFHFSPRYQGREDELRQEALHAWAGGAPAPPSSGRAT